MNIWDQRFSEPGYKYGTEPNDFLRQSAPLLSPNSRILVPGDGEGRNGVWLARQGHQVTSVDNSTVGLRKASELAASFQVKLTTQFADLSEWRPPQESFDALVLIYTHFPESFRTQAHRRLASGLTSGGWIVLEAFHPAQLSFASGGPKDESMLYTPEQLGKDFENLVDCTFAWHGETSLAEGVGHQGPGHVTRWMGRRH